MAAIVQAKRLVISKWGSSFSALAQALSLFFHTHTLKGARFLNWIVPLTLRRSFDPYCKLSLLSVSLTAATPIARPHLSILNSLVLVSAQALSTG